MSNVDPAPYWLPGGRRMTLAELREADGPTYREARYKPRTPEEISNDEKTGSAS